eukprot:sb/3468365/
MEKWLSLPPNSKTTESQTDVSVGKAQTANAAVQVGRDKASSVPQPSKINGFLTVVAPDTTTATKPPAGSAPSFTLPKRPGVKRGSQRKLLPRPVPPANTTQLVVSRNLALLTDILSDNNLVPCAGGVTSTIEVAPYTRSETPILPTPIQAPAVVTMAVPSPGGVIGMVPSPGVVNIAPSPVVTMVPSPAGVVSMAPLNPHHQGVGVVTSTNPGYYVEYTNGYNSTDAVRWSPSPSPVRIFFIIACLFVYIVILNSRRGPICFV